VLVLSTKYANIGNDINLQLSLKNIFNQSQTFAIHLLVNPGTSIDNAITIKHNAPIDAGEVELFDFTYLSVDKEGPWSYQFQVWEVENGIIGNLLDESEIDHFYVGHIPKDTSFSQASFFYLPKKPFANQDITFHAISNDIDGKEIISYEWFFPEKGYEPQGNERNITHHYSSAGEYLVFCNCSG